MASEGNWPDVKLASTLWSLLGSQSNEQEKATLEGAEAIAQLRGASQPYPPVGESSDINPDQNAGNRDDSQAAAAAALMADNEQHAAEGLQSYEDYEQGGDNEHANHGDEDFGALEIFDSNASQAPLSSAAGPVATEEPGPSHKRSKRDKKKKSARHDEKDDRADDRDAHDASTNTKKKRKLSDSVDGKHAKKRRSQDEDAQDHANAFMRRGDGDNAIIEEGNEEMEPDGSPSEARLLRRSRSREIRSREGSAAPAPDHDQMDIDQQHVPDDASEPAMASHDVEALAREAWNEHLNADTNGGETIKAPDADHSMYEAPESPHADMTLSSPRKSRTSKGKKAKPTFYEQPPELEANEDDLDALGNLPSPSALTPKPRNRSKKSSRGSKKGKDKLSHSMRGGSEEADGDDSFRGGRRNKMAGYTQGRFSDDELARITRAVDMFKNEHDLNQTQVNEMIQAPGGTTAGELHAQLWTQIFAECPDRHRQKIINVARKKFHNFVARGTWTTEQDAELTGLIQEHGQKWSKIGAIINRHPEDIRDRYRNYLVCGANQRKDTWNEQEEGRLTQYVIEAMEAIDELRSIQPSRELLKKPYEELIDWQNISERMDRTRSRLQCITKWKSLNIKTHGKDQLVSSQPDSQMSFRLEKARRQIKQMPEDERFRLVMAISATSAGTEAKVPWQRLADKEFRNNWHRTTQVLLWRRLRSTIPGQESKTTRDCAKELYDHYNTTGSLPDVDDSHFDVNDEMAFMSQLPASGAPSAGRSREKPARQAISSEFAMDSEDEGAANTTQNNEQHQHHHHEEDEDNAAAAAAAAAAAVATAATAALPEAQMSELQNAPEAVMSDIQIDPALAAATAESPEFEKVMPTPKKAQNKKTHGSTRKKSSKKHGADASQDLIQEAEAPAADMIAEDQAQPVPEETEESKEERALEHLQSAAGMADEDNADVGSDMGDMQDLPAKVAA